MKMFKGFAVGLLIVLAILAPACRSSRKKTPVVTATGTTDTMSVPDVPTTTDVETRVDTQPADFVQDTPRPTEEDLPRDIEQLNRLAQDRGFIRDAFFSYNESN